MRKSYKKFTVNLEEDAIEINSLNRQPVGNIYFGRSNKPVVILPLREKNESN